MKNLSSRDKIIVIGLGFVVAIFLFYQFIISPVIDNITDESLKISDQKKTVDQLEAFETSNIHLRSEIDKLKSEYEDKKQALPIELRDPDIQNDVNDLAVKNKVVLNAITFGDDALQTNDKNNSNTDKNKVKKGDLMLTNVTVNVQGDYISIMNFIKAVEGSKRISEFIGINIAKDATNNSTANTTTVTPSSNGQLNAGLNLDYYYIKGDAEDINGIKYTVTVPIGNNINPFK